MIRATALALTAVTGFTGLVYEISWQRYLSSLLGSASEASAAVLALFLGGLACGYALFGNWSRRAVEAATEERPAHLLLFYGLCEAAIGLSALIFPWTFDAVLALATSLSLPPAGIGFAVDVLLCALLVLPPAVLMGATVPVLTQALARDVADSGRVHAAIYALNTLGAFAGALTAGFVLVPGFGLQTTIAVAGVTNLVAGGIFIALGSRQAVSAPPPASPSTDRVGITPLALAAGLAGFAMMALQTTTLRVAALSLGSSVYTFAMVVAVFILGIGLGSLIVAAFRALPTWLVPVTQWLLFVSLVLLYLGADEAPYAGHVLRTLFRDTSASFWGFQLGSLILLSGVLVFPVGLSGALLPLLFQVLRREVGELGQVAGRIYAWNTVGSLAGALLGGYLALFWWDLHAVFRAVLIASGAAAALLQWRLVARFRPLALAGAAGVVLVAWLLPTWAPERMHAGAFRSRRPAPVTYAGSDAFYAATAEIRRLVYHRDGPNTSVGVTEHTDPDEPSRSLLVNGKSDGNTRADRLTMSLAGMLPALFAEPCERAFVIGQGLGFTAGVLASLDSIQEVVVAEISPAVIETAPLFDFANGGMSESPKVEILRGDAYRTLLRSDRTFDVIASEPSNPWVAGVELLYTRDFLEAARARLSPHGVYAHWIHRYEMDSETLLLMLRTFAHVFEEISVWYAMDRDLIVLGFNDAADARALSRIVSRAASDDYRMAAERAGIRGLPGLLVHEVIPAGVLTRERLPGPLHTVRHPKLAHAAAHAFFLGGTAPVPRVLSPDGMDEGAAASLLRRWSGSFPGGLPETQRAALLDQACARLPDMCVALLGEWLFQDREAPGLAPLLGTLPPDRINTALRVLPLFDVKRLVPGPIGPSAARNFEQLYYGYYEYAAPLPTDALIRIWERCHDEGDACERGLAAARERFGGS